MDREFGGAKLYQPTPQNDRAAVKAWVDKVMKQPDPQREPSFPGYFYDADGQMHDWPLKE